MPLLLPLGFLGSPVSPASSATSSSSAGFVTGSFTDTDEASNDTSVYTFSGMSFGSATADRITVVAVGVRLSSGTGIDAVTINGIAATLVVQASNGDDAHASLWRAANPSGTSGTVRVDIDGGNAFCCQIGVYRLSGATGAPTNTGSDTGNPISIAATVPTNGFAICTATFFDNGGSSSNVVTPSNYTEDYDNHPDTTPGEYMTGGHFSTSNTITMTGTTAGAAAGVYASWGA